MAFTGWWDKGCKPELGRGCEPCISLLLRRVLVAVVSLT
jgi:hypothetical protein